MRFLWVAFLLCLSVSSSLAMGWYSNACCNNRDCRPAKEGEVIMRGDGYHTPYGIVGYNSPQIQQSQDAQFHICLHFDSTEGTTTVRCLYVPTVA